MAEATEFFQIDTISVEELGQAVLNGAQSQQNSTEPAALDNFKRKMDSVVPEIPQILKGELTQFNTNFYNAYTEVLTQRADIGRILLHATDKTLQQEVMTTNAFTDTPPTTLVP